MASFACRRVALALCAFLGIAGIAHAEGAITTVDPAQAQALIASGVPVIDVRRPDEWQATGTVAGSQLLTAFDAEGRLVPGFLDKLKATIKPGEPVALICRSGNRSGKVAQLLEQAGYTHIYNVDGGVTRWAQTGQPLKPCDHC